MTTVHRYPCKNGVKKIKAVRNIPTTIAGSTKDIANDSSMNSKIMSSCKIQWLTMLELLVRNPENLINGSVPRHEDMKSLVRNRTIRCVERKKYIHSALPKTPYRLNFDEMNSWQYGNVAFYCTVFFFFFLVWGSAVISSFRRSERSRSWIRIVKRSQSYGHYLDLAVPCPYFHSSRLRGTLQSYRPTCVLVCEYFIYFYFGHLCTYTRMLEIGRV